MQRILCMFGRHKPDRRRVRYIDDEFVGPCIGCGAKMYRAFEGWKLAAHRPARDRLPPDETGSQPHG